MKGILESPVKTAVSVLIFILSLFHVDPVHAQGACREVFHDLPAVLKLNPQIMGTVVNGLREINPQVMEMKALPKWQDLNALSRLIERLENGDLPVLAGEPVKTVKQFKRILATEISPRLNSLEERPYQPTEYRLQSEFRGMLKKLNQMLPRHARLKIAPLSKDDRGTETQRQTDVLMERLQNRFEELFPTTGFKDLAEYQAAVRTRGGEKLRENFDLLEKGDFELSMRRPESGRYWIPRVGFHNQFVTGGSKGYYTPTGRNHAESGWTSTAVETYTNLNAEVKPKYGSIRPLPSDAGSRPANSETMYGPDVFILNTERVKDRLTFNLGDSNGLLYHNNGGAGWETRGHTPQAWDQSFIPWSHRTLLAPFLDRASFGRPGPASEPILNKTWRLDFQYFEIQIFGEVTFADVKAFEFTGTPPSGEFLRQLRENGVEIRDGRTWPAKIWSETSPAESAAAPEKKTERWVDPVIAH